MQEHLNRAVVFIRGGFGFLLKAVPELWAWAFANKKVSIPIALGVVVLIGALGYFLGQGAKTEDADNFRQITLSSVADVSSGEPITVIGEIRSVSEADVAPDSGGRVVGVYRKIGDFVNAGAIIAEIENSSQKAAVAQAEAALDRAKSVSTLSGISVGSASASAETARQNAYAAINDAVVRKADETFYSTGSGKTFYIPVTNSQLKYTLEGERATIETVLDRHASVRGKAFSDAELIVELQTLENEARTVRTFLAHLVDALSGGIASGSITTAQIEGYEANANGALSSVTALEASLGGASGGLQSAKENLTQGRSGENADIALAQASLSAAKAVLEKTIIRAPISGTINSISLETGNFATPGVPSVRIVNVSGLEAVAFLSERDLPRVTVGASVRISGIADGRVSRVAPALNPNTRKAEVRIAIVRTDTGNKFVSGQSATIEIAPARRENDQTIFVPIASVKITPDGSVVFIATEEDVEKGTAVLESVPVTLGTLSGGKVEITSGLSLNNIIVSDARGLKDGQTVLIKGQ
ncbi:efflux RND transporter periplasmic adaptor subunit [Patescibacteria group bacterium]|nr:efflux RND transporter periplasmic adaptor subunit [Patescibacteria group bacterium]